MLFRRTNEQIEQEIKEIEEQNKQLASDYADIKHNQREREKGKK